MARVDRPRYFYIFEGVFWTAIFWADDSYDTPEEVMKYMTLMITTNLTFAIIMFIEWSVKGSNN